MRLSEALAGHVVVLPSVAQEAGMRYHFGDMVLDFHTYELWQGGRRVPLRPKVFHVLAYLLRHGDRVVSKQELAEQLWPGQFISDETLSTCITAVRQAVGDSGEGQQIIQTRRGLGYRFVAPVVMVDQAAALAPEVLPIPLESHGNDHASVLLDASAMPAADVQVVPSSQVVQVAHGEYKPVTVLAGTLRHAEPSDADTLHHLLRGFFGLLQEVMASYGGTLHRHLDEGFMALFGAPLAYEDHARRAVLAALELQRRLERPPHTNNPRQDGTLVVGLGVHTGQVVQGPLDDNGQVLYTSVGDTLRLAVHLAQLVEPGAILLSAATCRLVHRVVQLEPGRTVSMPGQTAPLIVYGVRSPGSQRSPLAPAHTLSPFVGRQRELTTLQALFAQAVGGAGQVVSVIGDPGMGKSRLLYEYRQYVSNAQGTLLEGRCSAIAQATPYAPLLDLVRQACGMTDADLPEVMTSKLQHALQALGIAAETTAPYLLHLLDLPGDTALLADVSPQTLRARTFAALHQLLLASSQQRPLLLALEDLHWIDPTSNAYVGELIDCLAGAPLLLLVTFRPGYRPQWLDKSYATQVALTPLSDADSRRIVHTVLGTEQIPTSVLEAVLRKAGGNPFFLEELARTMREQGGQRLPADVPDTVQAVLTARLDRLPADAKHVLQVAAVIGPQVRVALLGAVVTLSETALLRSLHHLQSAEFLMLIPLMSEPTYTFKHALTLDSAYQSMLGSTRQQVHQQIAQVLERQFPDVVSAQPELLAHHYTEADLPEQALPYWQRAGQQTNARSAHRETLSHIARGLALLAALPDTAERRQYELRLQLIQAAAVVATSGSAVPEVARAYNRARVLAQQVGDSPELFAALRGLWLFYLHRGDYHTSLTLAEQALALAERLQDPMLLPWAHLLLGHNRFSLGDVVTARTHSARGFALYDRHLHRTRDAAFDPGVCSQGWWALSLWMLGYADQARQRMQAALHLAQELAHYHSQAFALHWSGALAQLCCAWDTAQAHAEALRVLTADHGLRLWHLAAMTLHAGTLLKQGRLEEGIPSMRQALEAHRPLGSHIPVHHFGFLAEAYGKAGQVEAAWREVHTGLALIGDQHASWYVAEMYRIKGVIVQTAAATGHYAGCTAEECLQQALTLARRQQARMWELRAATSLARLWQVQDRRQDAYDVLAPVYHWFTEGFDIADLKEAKALLDELR